MYPEGTTPDGNKNLTPCTHVRAVDGEGLQNRCLRQPVSNLAALGVDGLTWQADALCNHPPT